MTPEGRTIEVDIMTLFGQIDHKLDGMVLAIALKAETVMVISLQEKMTALEINGSHHAQTAVKEVDGIKQQISALGWKVAIALGAAILAFSSSVFMQFIKK